MVFSISAIAKFTLLQYIGQIQHSEKYYEKKLLNQRPNKPYCPHYPFYQLSTRVVKKILPRRDFSAALLVCCWIKARKQQRWKGLLYSLCLRIPKLRNVTWIGVGYSSNTLFLKNKEIYTFSLLKKFVTFNSKANIPYNLVNFLKL